MTDELQWATIEITETQTITTGAKPFKVIRTKSGADFTTFEHDLGEELYKGRVIAVGYEEKKKGDKIYRNIRELREASSEGEQLPKELVVEMDAKTKDIHRQVALYCANAIANTLLRNSGKTEFGEAEFMWVEKSLERYEKILNREPH